MYSTIDVPALLLYSSSTEYMLGQGVRSKRHQLGLLWEAVAGRFVRSTVDM